MTSAAQGFVMSLQDKVGASELIILQQKIEKVPDNELVNLLAVGLKNPILGLILGLLFGGLGVDRFYKGDILLGILKFLSCFILIGFVWVVIDYFLVYSGIKKDNFSKLMLALSRY